MSFVISANRPPTARPAAQYALRVLGILGGSCISAFAITTFLLPHQLLAGGVTGVGIMLQLLTGWPLWVFILALNIPIFLVGIRYVDRDFTVASLVGVGAFSGLLLLMKLFEALPGVRAQLTVENALLAALFGGLLNGFGLGLVFRQHASLGGIDILAVIMRRLFSIHIGSASLAMNAIVVFIAMWKFGLEPALFTLVSMMASSVALNKTVDGIDTMKSVWIVTTRAPEVCEHILRDLHRGVTVIPAEGGFTHSERQVLYCVITLTQLAPVKQIVREHDPGAFMTVMDTTEVLGRGFKGPCF